MDCIRGVYTSLRERRGQRTTRADDPYNPENQIDGSKHRQGHDINENGERNPSQPGGIRKFFGSLLSLRSRASSQAIHFEDETRKEDERSAGQPSNRGHSAQYSRQDTIAMSNGLDETEAQGSEFHVDSSENEASEIVPYLIAEQRLEEGELDEDLSCEEEEEKSEDRNEDGDTDIYPYPQPSVSIIVDNRSKSEESEIEVILRAKTSEESSKRLGKGEEDASLSSGSPVSWVQKGSEDATVSGEDQTNRKESNVDTESREIYVSRNIPVEEAINSNEKKSVHATDTSCRIETEHTYNDKSSKDFESEEDRENKNDDVISENSMGSIGKTNRDSSSEVSILEEDKVSGLSEIGLNANKDAIESSSEETLEKSRHNDEDNRSDEEYRDMKGDEESSLKGDHLGTEDCQSLGPPEEQFQSEQDENQSQSSNDYQSENSSCSQSESSSETSESEDETVHNSEHSQPSLPTASYMKNNIQITIIGEVDEEEEYGIHEDTDLDDAAEANQYRLI